MGWIEYNTGSSQEQKGELDSRPPGPYILVDQDQEHEFIKHFSTMTNYKVSNEFRLEWGKVTFAIGFDGPIKVGYYYDTSD